MHINPYISFKGNAEEAIEFYKSALGGTTEVRKFGDKGPPDMKDKVMHATLKIGDGAVVMMSDTPHDCPTTANISISINLNKDEPATEMFEKLSQGGKVTMPFQEQFWGDAFGMLNDKFGVKWMFNQSTK